LKFHQLCAGARFRFDGRIFQKISPLKASDVSDGSQRLVPRSAEIVALDEGGREIESLPETLDRVSVESAVTQLVRRLLATLDRIDPALQPSQRVVLQQAIEAAASDALSQLMAVNTRPPMDADP